MNVGLRLALETDDCSWQYSKSIMVDNPVHDFFNETHNYLHQSFGIRIRSEIVRELVGYPSGKMILDVGCGNGAISGQFIKDNQIAFLDLSENMIQHVKESIDPAFTHHADFLLGSFTEVPIGDTYDYVFAMGLLAHVPSVSTCVSRIHSLLRPGGRAIVQFSDYDTWLTRFNIRTATRYGYMINHLSFGYMKQVITTSGFEIVDELRFSFLLPGMGKLPDSLLYHYSRLFWKNKTLAKMGTDVVWLMKRKEE